MSLRHLHRHLAFIALLGMMGALPCRAADPATQPPTVAPSRAELDEAQRWLWIHPPDGRNAVPRRQRMATIQRAADALPPETYRQYVKAWTAGPQRADELEQEPVLYALRQGCDRAIDDIRRTRVVKGVAVWHFYNMGYVFKTPDACFGIDLHLRRAPRLADTLDFLLVTHRHSDHVSLELIDAMVAAGKPVVTSWDARGRLVNLPVAGAVPGPAQRTILPFGSVTVKIDVGDHHPNQPGGKDNMLMYQIDCGAASGGRTIYHSGDGANLARMCPDRPVDVFIPHVSVGLNIEQAIGHLKPQMTLVSHVLELGHSPKPPQAWRWSFDYAFGTIKNTPEKQATVLTWGERWLLPGTELQSQP